MRNSQLNKVRKKRSIYGKIKNMYLSTTRRFKIVNCRNIKIKIPLLKKKYLLKNFSHPANQCIPIHRFQTLKGGSITLTIQYIYLTRKHNKGIKNRVDQNKTKQYEPQFFYILPFTQSEQTFKFIMSIYVLIIGIINRINSLIQFY